MSSPSIEELPESRLGTKEHWDTVYAREVENYDDHGEEGEVWFGEDAVEKMVDWVLDNVELSPPTKVLDIGTGNGHLLFSLLSSIPPTHLTGVDYSPASVDLCRRIGAGRAEAGEEGADAVQFGEMDVLDPAEVKRVGDGEWGLVLDKGTYDAICLTPTDPNAPASEKPSAIYPQRVAALLKRGGYFLITSCNFTENEIKSRFTSGTGLSYHSRVPHPTFSFGGQTGARVCTVAFQKEA